MVRTKKVIVTLPPGLLERATFATGKRVSAAIIEGLEAMAVSHAFEGLRRLRGKVKLTIDVDQLRRDRIPNGAAFSISMRHKRVC